MEFHVHTIKLSELACDKKIGLNVFIDTGSGDLIRAFKLTKQELDDNFSPNQEIIIRGCEVCLVLEERPKKLIDFLKSKAAAEEDTWFKALERSE